MDKLLSHIWFDKQKCHLIWISIPWSGSSIEFLSSDILIYFFLISFLPHGIDKRCWVTVISWILPPKKCFFVLSCRSSRSFSFVFECAAPWIRCHWTTFKGVNNDDYYFHFLCIIIINLWWYELWKSNKRDTHTHSEWERGRKASNAFHWVYAIIHYFQETTAYFIYWKAFTHNANSRCDAKRCRRCGVKIDNSANRSQ